MKRSVIVSAIGPDRPGLIDRLASVIASVSGNWEGSRMLRLARQFTGMVQMVLEEDAVPELERALATLESDGLHTRVLGVSSDEGGTDEGVCLELEVVGQDRQGIVRAISGALAALGVNVTELATDCTAAPMSGERLFKTEAKLSCPAGLDPAAVRDAVEAIAADLMVELRAPQS